MDAVTINITPGVAFGTGIRPPFETPPRDGNQIGANITMVRSASRRDQHWTSSGAPHVPSSWKHHALNGPTGRTAQPDPADYENIREGINRAKHGLESASSQLQNCRELVVGLLTAFAIPPANASHSFDEVFATIIGVGDALKEVAQELAEKKSEQSPPAPQSPSPSPHRPADRPSTPRSHTRAAQGANADLAQRRDLPLPEGPPAKKPTVAEAMRETITIPKHIAAPPARPTPLTTSNEASAKNLADNASFGRHADTKRIDPEQQVDSYYYPNKRFEEFLKRNDRKVIPNPGNGNCAIYALLQPLLPEIGAIAMDNQVKAVRAEYDRLHPSDAGKWLHMDGGRESAVDDLIGIINKRYKTNILVKVVSAPLDDEPYVVHGTFPTATKPSKAASPSHHLTVWDQQKHYVAVVDPKGDNRRNFALQEIS